MDGSLSFKKLKLTEGGAEPDFAPIASVTKKESISKKDIAVIGMSCQIASAKNVRDYWNLLQNGIDGIRDYPANRKQDAVNYLQQKIGSKANQLHFNEKAFLDEIDTFDHQFFSLSKAEATLMDPNQRLFLETVWSAIEDAGYGGKKLMGTNTGIYMGFCNIALEEYLHFIETADPSLFTISVPGNIKSIIASRIAYLLDLKGPSMVIDTACSSSLTAVHLACQAIRGGDCEQAIVGGVKLNLIPGSKDDSEAEDIGISASDGRTRTFDHSSDGTGGGEGVAAVILKPLAQALADGDNVYAVIKGSAINQDGSSVGITAPNSAAQEAVITKAWEDARIDPTTISYIEAHGTATNLGDPVEINGIERAFRKFTDRKQFCAIGSVKTNIGHLDGAAGVAGLIKAVLALHHKQLPPSLHFKRPNRKINFLDSPVYVNDRLQAWETPGFPRRCGISSFGLSGTNAHIVLEEAPELPARQAVAERTQHVLTLSAKTKDGLQKWVAAYAEHLVHHPEQSLADICNTANTGRGQYSHRLALLVADRKELEAKLSLLLWTDLEQVQDDAILYGVHKLVTSQRAELGQGELTEETKRSITRLANERLQQLGSTGDGLLDVCQWYVQGADVEWDALYHGQATRKVSLPTYPFARKRCWVEFKPVRQAELAFEKKLDHPLLDNCIKSMNVEVYTTAFSIDRHWELREHVLNGHSILPGTAYVEIAREVGKRHYGHDFVELRDILFTAPLVVTEQQMKEVHTNVRVEGDHLAFAIVSQSDVTKEWVRHAEGKLYPFPLQAVETFDVETVKQNATSVLAINDDALSEALVHVGARWRNIRHLYLGEGTVLAEFDMTEAFVKELDAYYLYPSLLDGAVNAANGTMGDGLYLPLHYGKARFYRPIPAKFYSYLQKKSMSKESKEVATFDILLIDEQGVVFGEIEDYTIKQLHEIEARLNELSGKSHPFYQVRWVSQPLDEQDNRVAGSAALVFAGQDAFGASLIGALQENGLETILVEPGTAFEQKSADHFVVGESEEDYQRVLDAIGERTITRCLHLFALDSHREITASEQWAQNNKLGVDSLFFLAKALVASKRRDVELVVVGRNGYEVTAQDAQIEPHQAALYGLAKVISHEYSGLNARAIDIDDHANAAQVATELCGGKAAFLAAYRGGERYVEEFDELHLETVEQKPLQIKENGLYVITGGLGGIGLEIAKHLAAEQVVNLALLNRSSFPARDEWAAILEANEDEKVCRKIQQIQAIESNGSRVTIYRTDISKQPEVDTLFGELRQTFGGIHGIVHSAGVAGDGYLMRKEKQTFDRVLQPKVLGTWVLHQATLQDELDFFVMCSSLTSVFGAPGQADYTAANSYQDAFAAYRQKLGKPATTINWSGWSETGMAVDHGISEARSMFKPLTSAQGIALFDLALQTAQDRVMVGEIDAQMFATSLDQLPIQLSKALKSRIEKEFVHVNEQSAGDDQLREIVITGKAPESLSETEVKVAQIWAKVLGTEELDVYDKFFEIGGDSLLSSHLLKEVDKHYPNLMDITDVFIYSTVVEMAEFIESKQAPVQKQVPVVENKSAQLNLNELDSILEKLAMGEIAASLAEELLKK